MNLARLCRPLLLLFLLALAAGPAPATQGADPAALCLRAAAAAARETGVPLRVLLAISLAETGRKSAEGRFTPWPWALNQGGDSHWFDTSDAALAHLQQALDQGVTNIDIGCFQLNWRWHNQAFASPEAMIAPEANALYAARLLARLYRDSGDWTRTAGAYHSATPEYAQRYSARFATIYDRLGPEPGEEITLALADLPPETEEDRRTNGFPLLQAGGPGAMGSLVPQAPGGLPLFGG